MVSFYNFNKEAIKDDCEVYFLVKGKVQLFINEINEISTIKAKDRLTILQELTVIIFFLIKLIMLLGS